MASGLPLPSSGYEVVVPGRFGPAYLAAFAATGAAHSEVSSVFYLNPPQGMGIPDIAAMLQARGLVILDIRRVDSRAPGTQGQWTPDISHRGPVEGARDTGRMGSWRHRPNRGEAAMAHPCFDVPSDDFDEQQRPLDEQPRPLEDELEMDDEVRQNSPRSRGATPTRPTESSSR